MFFNLSRAVRKDQKDLANTLNVVKPPPIILDSHMHTMTSYCTPLPLLWSRLPWDLRVKRSTLDRGAVVGAMYPTVLLGPLLGPLLEEHLPGTGEGKMGLVGKLSTVEIGDLAVASNPSNIIDPALKLHFKEAEYPVGAFTIMVTLPMDMEYAHYEGFEGLQLYYKVTKREYVQTTLIQHMSVSLGAGMPSSHRVYLPPKPEHIMGGNTLSESAKKEFEDTRKREEARLGDDQSSAFMTVLANLKEQPGERYFTFWVEQDEKTGKRSREVVWLDPQEVNMFVAWQMQLKHISLSSVKQPWQIMPLLHYEPRRWAKGGTDYQSLPATKSQAGMFLGMKMYPPLGYKPSDWDRIKGLAEYYSYCEANEIPVMTHCSPEGMFSHERPQFLHNDIRTNHAGEYEALKAAYDKEQKQKRYKQSWEDFYFSFNYVSPSAWEPVLRRFPKLRLCLAHFGSDDAGFSGWGKNAKKLAKYGEGYGVEPWEKTILRLVQEYDNCYVDISFFFVKENLARLKEIFAKDRDNKIKDKILYGTDWYMIEMAHYRYEKFGVEAKKVLDAIDKTLWPRAAALNPMKYYNLPGVADNLAQGLKDRLDKFSNRDLVKYGIDRKKSAKEIDRRLELLKEIPLEPYAKSIGYDLE
jgi:predicted TIM-barrel fold metal-dependent hydrolase